MWPHEEKRKYPYSVDDILPKLKSASLFLAKINAGAILVLLGIIGCVVPNVFSADCIAARGALELLSILHLSGQLYILGCFYASAVSVYTFVGAFGAIFVNFLLWAAHSAGATRFYNWMIGRLASPFRDAKLFICTMHAMFFVLGFALFGSVAHADAQILRRLHDWPDLVVERERMRQVCLGTLTEIKPGDLPSIPANKSIDPSMPLPKHVNWW